MLALNMCGRRNCALMYFAGVALLQQGMLFCQKKKLHCVTFCRVVTQGSHVISRMLLTPSLCAQLLQCARAFETADSLADLKWRVALLQAPPFCALQLPTFCAIHCARPPSILCSTASARPPVANILFTPLAPRSKFSCFHTGHSLLAAVSNEPSLLLTHCVASQLRVHVERMSVRGFRLDIKGTRCLSFKLNKSISTDKS